MKRKELHLSLSLFIYIYIYIYIYILIHYQCQFKKVGYFKYFCDFSVSISGYQIKMYRENRLEHYRSLVPNKKLDLW